MHRKIVVGDIHGRSKELKKLLKKINFNFELDTLISLGDLVDRGPDFFGVLKLLDTIKNKILIKGNHDEVFLNSLIRGFDAFNRHHGSQVTHETFKKLNDSDKIFTLKFLLSLKYYHIDEENNIYIHAGFDDNFLVEENTVDTLIWDREFVTKLTSEYYQLDKLELKQKFNKIFLGHTPVQFFSYDKNLDSYNARGFWNKNSYKPITIHNVTLLDTGAGYNDGYLTAYDITNDIYTQVKVS